MNNKRILFLLINYFNEKEVAEFVSTQLGNQLNEEVQVIIINNSYNDLTTLKELENKYSNVKVLNPEKNLGYFGGANYGLQNYLKNNDFPNATIICNTDISFPDSDFISKFQTILNEKQFDILGPDIYSTFLKYHQNPYIVKRISLQRIKLYKFITSNTFFYLLFTLLHFIKTKITKSNSKPKINQDMETYAIHGSFMVFNKSYFTKGGTISTPTFLFGEELFVAETARKLGLKTIYEPSLIVNHFQNATTGTFKSASSVGYLHQSYSYLLETFFNEKIVK